MEERDLTHFEGRLEKDTFTKEEVAKLLHNEANFTADKTRKEFSGYVAGDKIQEYETKVAELESQLKPYKENEFNSLVEKEFSELNGKKELLNEFKTLSNIELGTDIETVKAKTMEFKQNPKYNFLFEVGDSGAIKQTVHTDTKQKASLDGMTLKPSGWTNIFKK